MRKSLLLLFTSLAICFFTILPEKSKATHAAGGEIIYEYITGNTYRVFFKFYRDCTGIPAPNEVFLCYKNTCNTTIYTDTMFKYTGLMPPGVPVGSPVSLGCWNGNTKCENLSSPVPGYEEWWYYVDVDLPFQCNYWTFYANISARNGSNNIQGQPLLYVESTFDNLNAHGNSSPYFSIKPIPYVCINVPYTYNNGAVDPNSDSLTTEIVQPLEVPLLVIAGPNCNVTPTPIAPSAQPSPYPPISWPAHPIQTGGTFALSPTTGNMSFTAPLQGPQTLTVKINEWRAGQLIGSVMRDIQVQVLNICPPVVPPTTTVIPNTITGGAWVNNQVHGCVETPLQFSFDSKISTPNSKLIIEDNHAVSIPGSSVTYSNQVKDSVRGTFNWTPSLTQTGLYVLTVTVKDTTCDPPGILFTYIRTISIFIWPATRASKDTSVCPGNPVQLSVVNGGNFMWNTLSGPANTLNNPNSQFPIATTYAPVTYMVQSGLTPFCGNKSRDTVKIDMLPGPTFTPVPDILTCPGTSTPMDLKLPPIPGVTYSVKWSPGTYLNNSTIQNPITTPQGDITYHIVIGATNNTCKGFDTVNVEVLDGFDINSEDTVICLGQSVQVNTSGDTRYSYNWTTNDLSGGASISDPAIMNPVITPPGVGSFTYTLNASFAGCEDSAATFKIEVQPIPTVALPEDAKMCYNDTMQLGSLVTPPYAYSYTWTPGNTLNNANIPNPIFKALNTTTLTMTAYTSAGCKDEDDILLTVFPAHFMHASPDTAICPRDTAYLSMTGDGLKSFFWGPAQDISDINSSIPYVWPSTNEQYLVYGRDTNGCFDTAKVRVTVKPAAVLDLPKSVLIYPGESYQLNPKGNALNYKWYPPAGLSADDVANPLAKPAVNTRYIVKAFTEFNCVTTDSIDVLVSPDSHIEIPNAFAPGSKSKLKVIHMGVAKLKTFAIYNRWGVKVFETSDINEGWDGNYKGEPQPLGVYVYTIDAESYTGRKLSKQGNVTLIR